MSAYTTGELAKACGVSVRTVQYYDTKDLLRPTELTEGGRRIYSDDDLRRMRLILLLKSLGLSLDAIRGILTADDPNRILMMLLDEQEMKIRRELVEKQDQLEAVLIVRKCIRQAETIPVQSIHDMEIMMKQMKLRGLRVKIAMLGIAMAVIKWGSLLFGVWQPLAVGAVVIVMCLLLLRTYYLGVNYICPQCGHVFRPAFTAFLFAGHTPKTRRLRCPACDRVGYCVETIAVDRS